MSLFTILMGNFDIVYKLKQLFGWFRRCVWIGLLLRARATRQFIRINRPQWIHKMNSFRSYFISILGCISCDKSNCCTCLVYEPFKNYVQWAFCPTYSCQTEQQQNLQCKWTKLFAQVQIKYFEKLIQTSFNRLWPLRRTQNYN